MGEVNANLEKNITLLILIVGIMPLVWGTIVYSLMSKLWRQSRTAVSRASHTRGRTDHPFGDGSRH